MNESNSPTDAKSTAQHPACCRTVGGLFVWAGCALLQENAKNGVGMGRWTIDREKRAEGTTVLNPAPLPRPFPPPSPHLGPLGYS